MVSTVKNGLSYYNMDTDIFQNRKIRRLLKFYSAKGWLVYSFVLNEIYRNKGFYLEFNDETIFDIADYLNIPTKTVIEIVEFCCEIKLFDNNIMEKDKIITSKNIQLRWEKITKSAKRKISEVKDVNSKIDLTPEYFEKTPEYFEKTPEYFDKVKKSKVNIKEINSFMSSSSINTTTCPKPIFEKSLQAESKSDKASVIAEDGSDEVRRLSALANSIAKYVKYELPTNQFSTKGEVYQVTSEYLDEMQKLFEGLDVNQEFKLMKSWLLNNAQRRKTLRGMPAFINNWLSKSQNNQHQRKHYAYNGTTGKSHNQNSGGYWNKATCVEQVRNSFEVNAEVIRKDARGGNS